MVPIIISSSYVMANARLGWPVWAAVSVDSGYGAIYGAGIATFSLIATTIWIISLAVPDNLGSISKKR